MKQMDKIIKDYNYKVQYEYLKDKPLIAVQGNYYDSIFRT